MKWHHKVIAFVLKITGNFKEKPHDAILYYDTWYVLFSVTKYYAFIMEELYKDDSYTKYNYHYRAYEQDAYGQWIPQLSWLHTNEPIGDKK